MRPKPWVGEMEMKLTENQWNTKFRLISQNKKALVNELRQNLISLPYSSKAFLFSNVKKWYTSIISFPAG